MIPFQTFLYTISYTYTNREFLLLMFYILLPKQFLTIENNLYIIIKFD